MVDTRPPTVPLRRAGYLEPAPFAVLRRQVEALASLTREEKLSILTVSASASLVMVNFNEDWYLSAYPDVKVAIKSGAFKSGQHHYQAQGYFEGRIPAEISVDEDFYCKTYPDVKQAIDLGLTPGAKLHFLTKGYQEGRVPSSAYSFVTTNFLALLDAVSVRVRLDTTPAAPVSPPR